MSTQQPTNINAYHAEAIAALARANQAQQDIQALMSGQDVQPSALPGPDYVQAFAQLRQSPQFANLPPEVQNKIMQYLQLLSQMVNQAAQQQGAPV